MEEDQPEEVPVHPFFSTLEKRNQSRIPKKLAPMKIKKKKRRRKKRRRGGVAASQDSQDSQVSNGYLDESMRSVSPSKKPVVNINTDELFSLSVANKRKRSRRKKKRRIKKEVGDGVSIPSTPATQSTKPVSEVEITITKPSPEVSFKENDVPQVRRRKRKRIQFKPPSADDVDTTGELPSEEVGEDDFTVHTNIPPPKKDDKNRVDRKYVKKRIDEDSGFQRSSIPKISRKRNSDDIRTDDEDKLEEEIEDMPAVEEDEQETSNIRKKGFTIAPLDLGDDDDDDDDDEILEDHEFLITPKGVEKREEETSPLEEHTFSEPPKITKKKMVGIVGKIKSKEDPEVQSMLKLTKRKLPSLKGIMKHRKRKRRDDDTEIEMKDIRKKEIIEDDEEDDDDDDGEIISESPISPGERMIPKSPKQREESSGLELRESKDDDDDDDDDELSAPLPPTTDVEEEEVVIPEPPPPPPAKRNILGILRSRVDQQQPQQQPEGEDEQEDIVEEGEEHVSAAATGEEVEDEIYGEVGIIEDDPTQQEIEQQQKKDLVENARLAQIESYVSTASSHVKSVGRRAVNLYHNFSYHDPLSKVTVSEHQKPLDRFRTPLAHQKPIMQVTIIRSRILRNVVRPFVKVTFIDTEKKSLLEKGRNTYHVSHRYEYVGTNPVCEHILPQSTQMFPVFKTKSLRPIWNEKLLFNENFSHFLNPNAVVVFELMDFDLEKKDMVYVAWGFLKLISLSGRANARRTLPIKLFKYPRRLAKNNVLKHPETKGYYLWATRRKRSFPSVLMVSIDPVERKKFIPDCPDLPPSLPNPLLPVSRNEMNGEEGGVEDLDYDYEVSGEQVIDTEDNVPPPNKSSEIGKKKKEEEEEELERHNENKTPDSPETKMRKNREKNALPSLLRKKKTRDAIGRRMVRFPRRTKNIFEVEVGREKFEDIALKFGFTRIRAEGGEEEEMIQQTATMMKDKERKARDLRKKLRRKNHERCKIPDTPLFQFETAQFGCLRVRFSPLSGVFLACCCVGLEGSVVRVYNVWTGQLYKELIGHRQIIYDVCWGKDDTFLVTAGQDGTARIYDFKKVEEEEEEEEEIEVEEEEEEELVSPPESASAVVETEEVIEIEEKESEEVVLEKKKKKKRKKRKKNPYQVEARCILPHPCFVYCVQIYYPPERYIHRIISHEESEEDERSSSSSQPKDDDNRLVLTGGYDHMIRIFSLSSGEKLREISHHHARVNSILFDRFKRNMYTADGSGVIKKWRIRNQIGTKPGEKKKPTQFEWLDTFEIPNCCAALTTIYRHPERDDWLFVHSQDNMIRLMSTVGQKCIGRYTGVKCVLNAQRSNVSPDEYGSFIVTGSSNDGNCYFWKRRDQKLVRRYGINYGFGNNPIYDIAWSKKEHVIALCSYGVPEPVRLYCYEKKRGEDRDLDDYDDDDEEEEEDDEVIVSLEGNERGKKRGAATINKKKKKGKFDWKNTLRKLQNQPKPETVEDKMKRLFSKTSSMLHDIKKKRESEDGGGAATSAASAGGGE